MVSSLRTAGAMTWRWNASGRGLNDSCHLKDIHIDKRKHDFSILENLSLTPSFPPPSLFPPLPFPPFTLPSCSHGQEMLGFLSKMEELSTNLIECREGMLLKVQGGSESLRTVGMEPLIPSKLIIATKIVVILFDTLLLMGHFGSIILLILTMAL